MKRFVWVVFIGLLMVPAMAFAHGAKGPHGGQMLLSGSHRFEMVVGASNFTIYVMDMKKQVLPLQAVSGSATVHSNNDKDTNDVPLVVEGDHLVGKLDLKKLGKAEVHAKIKVDGKEATMAFEYPED
jgi:hypothetical protein